MTIITLAQFHCFCHTASLRIPVFLHYFGILGGHNTVCGFGTGFDSWSSMAGVVWDAVFACVWPSVDFILICIGATLQEQGQAITNSLQSWRMKDHQYLWNDLSMLRVIWCCDK